MGTDEAVRELAYRGWSNWDTRPEQTAGSASSFGVESEFFGIARDTAVALLNRDARVHAENDGYHHDARDYWRVTSDSSVHGEGNEVVSPILNVKRAPHFTSIKRVTDTLKNNGGDVDRTCGVHVHHSASAMTPVLLAETISHYGLFQQAIDNVLPPSRRVWGVHRDREAFNAPIQRLDSINSQLRDPGRTRARMADVSGMTRHQVINLQALPAHNTIEFRQHSGSLNPSKINNWVKFTKLFMEIGKKKSAVDLLRDHNWSEDQVRAEFDGITKVLDYLGASDELKDYYIGREALFGAEHGDEEDKFAAIHFSHRNREHTDTPAYVGSEEEWCASCAMYHPTPQEEPFQTQAYQPEYDDEDEPYYPE
jgi:hypothetical protein